MKTICFCAIVKNESKIIERCLESVKHLMDYWIIIDTGSTDNTQNIIKNYLKNIPGELIEKPWIDFATCRNYYVQAAAHKTDYILHQDADEIMIFDKNFNIQSFKQNLTADVYGITFHMNTVKYVRRALFKNNNTKKYVGVIHENLITHIGTETYDIIHDFYQTSPSDGNRSIITNWEEKFLKDAQIFQNAINDKKTDPNIIPRYKFYLANSLRDANQYEKAINAYLDYIQNYAWNQEAYMAYYHCYKLATEKCNHNPDNYIHLLHKACELIPERLESPFLLTRYYLSKNYNELAYRFAYYSLFTQPKQLNMLNTLFYESEIYDYHMPIEYSVACYNTQRYHECLDVNIKLLDKSPPEYIKNHILHNINCCKNKLNLA